MRFVVLLLNCSLLLQHVHILTSQSAENKKYSRLSVVKRQHDWNGFLFLCQDCENPSRQGVIVEVFAAARGMVSYKIENARLVYAIPNHGNSGVSSRSEFLNESLIPGAVVVMDKSKGVSIVEKASQVQRYKAAGIIVIENESDDEIRILSNHLFDTTDHWAFWDAIKIPCILIRANMSAKFLAHVTNLEETSIEGLNRIHREPL